MVDIGAVAGVVGGIAGLFGKGSGRRMDKVQQQLNMLNQINQRGTDLYDNTNLEESDAKATDLIRNLSTQDALNILSSYDGSAAGAGSPIWKDSTSKGRARNQIAFNASNVANRYAADLETSRANRKAALLPSPAGAAQGLSAASAIDSVQNEQNQADQNALFQGVYGLSGILGKSSAPKAASVKKQKMLNAQGVANLVGKLRF